MCVCVCVYTKQLQLVFGGNLGGEDAMQIVRVLDFSASVPRGSFSRLAACIGQRLKGI